MDITPANIAALQTQFDMRYQAGYKRRKTYWQDFCELVPSGTKQNLYSWLAELPGLRKWVGPKLSRNIALRSYSLINDDHEDTFEVDRNDIEDDQLGAYGRKAELLGDAAARWPDDLMTSVLINGNTTLCYDGQNFFDLAHPVDIDDSSKGTYANSFTSRPLTQANFNYVYAQMQQFKGESGKVLEVTPTLLITGPGNREIAMEICKGALIAQAIKNVAASENVGGAAASNVNVGEVTPTIMPRLVDDTAGVWYLASTDRIKPLIFQQRKPPTPVQMIDPQNPAVFRERKLTYGVEARGVGGYGLPFLMTRAVP